MAYIDISIFGKSYKLTLLDGNKILTFFESPNFNIKGTWTAMSNVKESLALLLSTQYDYFR